MSKARNAIDQFILARLDKDNVAPSPEADRITLLRRLSLDLIGLPPTPEEVDKFLADKSTDAYERQVERLLKSPHYGERWGRWWLDAATPVDALTNLLRPFPSARMAAHPVSTRVNKVAVNEPGLIEPVV